LEDNGRLSYPRHPPGWFGIYLHLGSTEAAPASRSFEYFGIFTHISEIRFEDE
jgi:hypothetical protein